MTTIWLAALGALVVTATPALAVDVEKSVEVKAEPGKVWAAIGDFCGIGTWHPAVAKCVESKDGDVAVRTLTLGGGGGTLVESLVARDDKAMTYTYRIVSGPLPVSGYESTIKVEEGDEEGETEILWTGKFDAKGASDEEAAKVIGGIYDAGLAALKAKAAM